VSKKVFRYKRYPDSEAAEVFSRLPANRVGENDYKYMKEVMDIGFGNSDKSDMNARFEMAFAKKFESKYAATCANGTVSLQACLLAAGVGPGDEVIVPPLTAGATALAVLHCYAVPVFADVDPETFTIDPDDIRRKITPHTKAIIPVSIYGLACDMDPIMDMAKEFDLTVIEDNAQCFLGKYKGRLIGTIGQAASFSFQGSKHITTGGDGGAVVSSDKDYMTKIKKVMCVGYPTIQAESNAPRTIPRSIRQDWEFRRHPTMGYNFRMPITSAALGMAQLERLDDLVEARKIIAGLYDEVAYDVEWIIRQKVPEGYESSCWAYTCRIDEKVLGKDWRTFRSKFIELGGDGLYSAWYPLHLEPTFRQMNFYGDAYRAPNFHPLYKGNVKSYERGDCPVIESIQPTLAQFKTSFQTYEKTKQQVEALTNTIKYFGK
jgi:perosamine synthetase